MFNKDKMKKMTIVVPGLVLGFLIIYFLQVDYRTKADKRIASYTIGWKSKKVDAKDLVNGKIDTSLVYLDEYAELSSLVYGNEFSGKGKFDSWRKLPIPMIPMDLVNDSKVKLGGLKYELWSRNDNNTKKLVAIVFKGTNLENLNDWSTNLRWIRRIATKNKWDYYDQLNHYADSIIGSIHKYYELDTTLIEIVSTGHSLGGGLAQFMAYRINEIKTVYVFNSSPVTGYYDIPSAVRNKNKQDCTIFRFFESGEALSPIRKLLTVFYPAPILKREDPRFVIIRFDFITMRKLKFFQTTNPFPQHSIFKLTQNIAAIKRSGEPSVQTELIKNN